MPKKVKAIITVEIEEIGELPPIVECILENGNKITLSRDNLVISTPYTGYDVDSSNLQNYRVTC